MWDVSKDAAAEAVLLAARAEVVRARAHVSRALRAYMITGAETGAAARAEYYFASERLRDACARLLLVRGEARIHGLWIQRPSMFNLD